MYYLRVHQYSFQKSQETALTMAAWKGSVEIIRKLIQHGADVNLTNKVPINETCVVCVCVCVWNEIE